MDCLVCEQDITKGEQVAQIFIGAARDDGCIGGTVQPETVMHVRCWRWLEEYADESDGPGPVD